MISAPLQILTGQTPSPSVLNPPSFFAGGGGVSGPVSLGGSVAAAAGPVTTNTVQRSAPIIAPVASPAKGYVLTAAVIGAILLFLL